MATLASCFWRHNLEFELDGADTAFNESAVSFEITDVKLFANLHTFDSDLANAYASHVLKGNPLHLHYSSVVASRHLVTGSNVTISLVRGVTRLKQCFVVFLQQGEKKTKSFHSPFNGTYNTDVDDFTWQLSIGLTLALLFAFVLSLAIGPAGIGIPGLIGVFANPTAEATILFDIRFPRA